MKNIRELEETLCEMLSEVKANPEKCKQAQSVARLAGELIQTQNVSIRYAEFHGETVELPFMKR